ncbi:heme o synthase [Brucella suis]|uniref:Protoheme IX farnesyltransferase n=1 Tax=Brucella suis (strain ATCC 23445 / NCTC 10510) TaxID=470137 RepID=COXX_BRUSI|nr:heme o synthase [Brucella suis]B0CKF4.1 RecName: Full=Protoheme IX farnesyltransferase; AltName: Full=Heme B farnesyltransferase; AltName: Full=Heme O synthase [Brucella suis ATCC 23445]ABY37584.1 protoheme IX farnesyltransferase [Brucella suis ATCC 23445]AIB17212.1 Heme O synthase, protoheme IX farnesyltransferase COX10-CtaB [Brucella suis bv. 2]AIB21335.1 Heme O synthase, protoheme IX farnesyltransferase COX10-CtaB [Brucella suis bv. 2]AIB24689.1 Heme O synthase, protoheme IX farnesyltran
MSLVEKNTASEDAFALSEATARDYLVLLKPRVMSLVVFTGLVGLVLAPGHMNPVLAVISILCIAVGAGASGALNMWYDADIDAVMKRTRKRPIPAGIIAPNQVLAFGLTLSAFSVMTLGLMVNWLAAALLAFTIFFYAVIYTMWLKRSTPQNIVIGGAAGAFPPMIGWAAATGEITWDSLVLFMIIFLWTPPHFWALSLFTTNDYEAARIPMMPNVKGELSTRRQALFYAVLMAPVGVLPWVMGFAGMFYGVVSTLLGLAFVYYAWRLWAADSQLQMLAAARKLFRFSLLYLAGIFAVLLFEALTFKLLAAFGVF